MKIRRIVPVIESSRMEETKRFYGEFIGLELAMDMDWALNYISQDNTTAQVIVIKSANEQTLNSGVSISMEVVDLDSAYDKAASMGYQIVYPKSKEPWGVERFFVKDPNGVIINIMRHI